MSDESRELTELLYAVSHDLGAPLRVIDGFSEALLEDQQDVLPPDALEYLTTIRSSVARMNEMFDAMQQLNRVSHAPLRRTEVDVTALARSLADERRAAEPSREVRFSVQPGLVANADADLLRIALAQLLGNAWKFTAGRTDAAVTVGREGDGALFVQDNGAGFDPAVAKRMFTPFQRFHHAAEFDGIGIGLALVRRIVHRHGGAVRATGALQQGMTVYLELP